MGDFIVMPSSTALNKFFLSEIWFSFTLFVFGISAHLETFISNNKAVLSEAEGGVRITSPIIGTAYLSPEPSAKQFIKIGDKIKKGQTIMIVEAMKTMNHIPSTGDGEVKNILVKDGHPVEFGQTLILLK